jgi:hypothetical protein
MTHRDPYCHIEAFIEAEQIERTASGMRQLVTVMMITGTTSEIETAACQLTARQARDLAFQLLVEAEHAERLTDHVEPQR